jgi:hypothetical protein
MADIAFIIRKKHDQQIMAVVHGTRGSITGEEAHHRYIIRQWLREEKKQDPTDLEFIYFVEEQPLYHWCDWSQFA